MPLQAKKGYCGNSLWRGEFALNVWADASGREIWINDGCG
ncbi:hypothetical protein RA210_U330006 [Rubrivivax sp. A210]|nr:hypothetical protein RA210_U330006 [Rubrivivax sp. A210]